MFCVSELNHDMSLIVPHFIHQALVTWAMKLATDFFFFYYAIHFFFNVYINFYLFIYLFFTLQYYIGFAIHQHASTTGVHDPEGWYGEGGGRGVQDGEHVLLIL